MSYVNLQWNLTSEEMLIAKKVFVAFSRKQGVGINQYHAENELFADNASIQSSKSHYKKILMWGKLTLAKWDRQAEDQRYERASM